MSGRPCVRVSICLSLGLPDDGGSSCLDQVLVGLAEVVAPEKTSMGRQRGGVYALKNAILLRVDHGGLALGIVAPEHIHDALFVLGDGLNHCVGKTFPTLSGMGGCFVCPDGQYGVEQQNTLLGPAIEVTAGRYRSTDIGLYLLKNIDQRGRKGYSPW